MQFSDPGQLVAQCSVIGVLWYGMTASYSDGEQARITIQRWDVIQHDMVYNDGHMEHLLLFITTRGTSAAGSYVMTWFITAVTSYWQTRKLF